MLANLFIEAMIRLIHFCSDHVAMQFINQSLAIWGAGVVYGYHHDLDWSAPGGERSPVIFDQVADETLMRRQRCPMDDEGHFVLTMFVNIGEFEILWRKKIHLDR